MQINLDIDDELLTQAMTATGLPTSKETLEEGLRTLIQRRSLLAEFDALAGSGWEGNLDAMREGRDFGTLP